MSKHDAEGILLALEKIARKTGEDEDDFISELERHFDIIITEEEVLLLKEVLRFEHVCIWVLKPFSQTGFLEKKEVFYFVKRQVPNLLNILVMKKEINGSHYIQYPRYVMLSAIQDSIFEELLEDHGINYYDFTENEWEDVLTSNQYKSTVIQIARELIAQVIYHEVNIK